MRQRDLLPPKGNQMGACCCMGGSVPRPHIQQAWICLRQWQHMSAPIQPPCWWLLVWTGGWQLPCIAWRILNQILCVHRMFLLCISWGQGRRRFLHLWHGCRVCVQEHFYCLAVAQQTHCAHDDVSRAGRGAGATGQCVSVCVRPQMRSVPPWVRHTCHCALLSGCVWDETQVYTGNHCQNSAVSLPGIGGCLYPACRTLHSPELCLAYGPW